MFQSPSRPTADIANSRAPGPRGSSGLSRSVAIDSPPPQIETERPTRGFWAERIRVALAQRSAQAFEIVEDALRAFPADAEILLLAALTALAGNQPDRASRLLKRYGKHFKPGKLMTLLMGLTLAQNGQFAQAWTTLAAEDLTTDRAAHAWFIGNTVMEEWLYDRLREIRRERLRVTTRPRMQPSVGAGAKSQAANRKAAHQKADGGATPPVAPTLPAVPELPRLEALFDMTVDLFNPDVIEIAGGPEAQDADLFDLRGELVRLSLFEGFDELLCV